MAGPRTGPWAPPPLADDRASLLGHTAACCSQSRVLLPTVPPCSHTHTPPHHCHLPALLRLLKLIKFSEALVPKMGLAPLVLKKALPDLVFFMLVFFITLLAFSQYAGRRRLECIGFANLVPSTSASSPPLCHSFLHSSSSRACWRADGRLHAPPSQALLRATRPIYGRVRRPAGLTHLPRPRALRRL